jgi:hypothetical protein
VHVGFVLATRENLVQDPKNFDFVRLRSLSVTEDLEHVDNVAVAKAKCCLEWIELTLTRGARGTR